MSSNFSRRRVYGPVTGPRQIRRISPRIAAGMSALIRRGGFRTASGFNHYRNAARAVNVQRPFGGKRFKNYVKRRFR